jgi:hypothetical protein
MHATLELPACHHYILWCRNVIVVKYIITVRFVILCSSRTASLGRKQASLRPSGECIAGEQAEGGERRNKLLKRCKKDRAKTCDWRARSELNDGEAGDQPEVTRVARCNGITEVECGYTDFEVRERDRYALFACPRIDLPGQLRHLVRERVYRNRREDLIEVRTPLLGDFRVVARQ